MSIRYPVDNNILRQGGLSCHVVTQHRGPLHNFQASILVIAVGKKRLLRLVSSMASSPDKSLPNQCGSWADLKAAYRLLNHPEIAPEQLNQVHRTTTSKLSSTLPVVLSVQDTTDLDYTHRSSVNGLGCLGDGFGRGFRQHTSLAVSEQGEVFGILEQKWFTMNDLPEGETRRQRQSRWTEPDIWGDTAKGIGRWPESSRLVHVGDRHSDVFRFLCICRDLGHGFLVRSMHDRYLSESDEKLWSHLVQQPVMGYQKVAVSAQRTKFGKKKRNNREANLSIRYSSVLIPPPKNDPRTANEPAVAVWAIYALEEDVPDGETKLEWMLLTSEPITSLSDAERYLQWYRYRWLIEEWHRALKEGCKLEKSQLDDIEDLKRLAAIVSVIAVRLLQLRDIVESQSPLADDPQVLQRTIAPVWIEMVSALSKIPQDLLTPRKFVLVIAKRGGFLGRKNDGHPGWKTIWQGWYEISKMVEGVELLRSPPNCG